ncbi:MAG: UDP-N-acetylglucosamine--N-acetylmuramyl-(pentapeptide) pyrophosphoryl-undecaprenol N-acetylglucosamine transferase [Phycisphaeraceae bacterium]
MTRSVVLAGGGTGGHIYPNIAIAQRFLSHHPDIELDFVISDRQVDQRVREGIELSNADWIPSPARPLARSPMGLVRFAIGWRKATLRARRRLQERAPLAVVATGGFVSAPEILAARSLGIPTALVSLDATPGRAIRQLAPRVDRVFSTYPTSELPEAEVIGFPLRREAVPDIDAEEAREQLGLMPDLPTLLVTAGSQGASTINHAVAHALEHTDLTKTLAGWQLLHLTGGKDVAELTRAYARSGLHALIRNYEDAMGLAWRAASLTIARPGASSVAEAWANQVPAIFMPYPYHADEHQRHNAQPMVDAGGAVLLRDQILSEKNAIPLSESVYKLVSTSDQLPAMRQALGRSTPADGADRVVRWVLEQPGCRL